MTNISFSDTIYQKGDNVMILLESKVVEKSFTTNDTILVFIIIVAAFGLFFGIGIAISTYPSKFWISKLHKSPILDINKYYFYYQKATAYRMLYIVHTIFSNTFQILGSTTTFITVYCAIDSNDYILLFSLIAAISQCVLLLIPTDKYSKVYVEAARLLEYELNEGGNDEKEIYKNLKETYKKAEEIIQKDFI